MTIVSALDRQNKEFKGSRSAGAMEPCLKTKIKTTGGKLRHSKQGKAGVEGGGQTRHQSMSTRSLN